jgi:hypothetical protein
MRPFVRSIWVFIVGMIVGTAIGLAAGLVIFPFVFAPPPATEQRSESDRIQLASGSFIHFDPSDSFHWGKGSATLFEGSVFLEQDFEVGPGPKYHVYLSSMTSDYLRDAVGSGGSGRLNEVALYGLQNDLGRLKSFKGSQRFEIPADADASKAQSIVIWCSAFNVLITVADLKKTGA